MILIGIGANLPFSPGTSPLDTCVAALGALDAIPGVRVVGASRWFESAPVPASDQPWFVNGVARLETELSPAQLLDALHGVEADFGRVRAERNAPRVLDLDLLAYDEVLISGGEVEIPHPRLHQRAFVLLPLGEIAPEWVHPQTGEKLKDLVAKLPKDQICRPLNCVNSK